MRLNSKLAISVGFVLAILAVALTAEVSYRNARALVTASDWVVRSNEVRSELEGVLGAVTQTETAQRGFTITGDHSYLGQYQTAASSSHAHLRHLQQVTSNSPAQQKRLNLLEQAVQRKLEWQSSVIATRQNKGDRAAEVMVATGKGHKAMFEIQRLVAEMENEEGRLLEARTADARTQANTTLSGAMLFSVTVTILLGLSCMLILQHLADRERTQRALEEAQQKLQTALQNEAELARLDPLTRLANRRAFFELLEAERSRTVRYGRPLTLVYLDLDGFKQVNDSLGHAVGDELLKVVATTLRSSVRVSDTVARVGGDEFALLLPESGVGTAEVVLRKLQSRLLHAMQDRQWPVTFSMGAVTFLKIPLSSDEMLHSADRLMYEVKSHGKNGIAVETYRPAPEEGSLAVQ